MDNNELSNRINSLFPMNMPFEKELRIGGINVDIEELKRQPVYARSIEDEYLIEHFHRSPKSLDRSYYEPVSSNLEHQDPEAVYEDISQALNKYMEVYDRYHQQKHFLYMHHVDYYKLVYLLDNTYMARCIYNPQPDNLNGFGLLHGNRRTNHKFNLYEIYSQSDLDQAVSLFKDKFNTRNSVRVSKEIPDYIPMQDFINHTQTPVSFIVDAVSIPIEVAIAYLIYIDKQKSKR